MIISKNTVAFNIHSRRNSQAFLASK